MSLRQSIRMAGIVVILDFDKTIIDSDSDNWVIDELGFTDLFNELQHNMPWNTMMDRMMEEMHFKGRTIGDVVEVLKRIPIHPRVVPAIRAARSLGCDLRIVSDANVFFIETILRHLGIRECFSEINTNPSHIDNEGRLRISPCHDFRHGCPLCPPNLCKGLVMGKIQSSISNEKIIYLGDGSGDYCPSLKLGKGDYVMPRKGYPLWDMICQDPLSMKAVVHEWSHGDEFEHKLLHLIDRIISTKVVEEASDGYSIPASEELKLVPMHVLRVL